jgi:serine/threonine protein kinase
MAYDLTGIVDKKVKFSLPQIKYIMWSLLRGLDYLHAEQSLAHRDIKGANILLSADGKV